MAPQLEDVQKAYPCELRGYCERPGVFTDLIMRDTQLQKKMVSGAAEVIHTTATNRVIIISRPFSTP